MESQPQNPEFRIDPENFHPRTCEFTALLCHFAAEDLAVLQTAFLLPMTLILAPIFPE